MYRAIKEDGVLHITEYETRNGKTVIIDEVPPIVDTDEFQFVFDGEKQCIGLVYLPWARVSAGFPIWILKASDWEGDRVNDWNWAGSQKGLFELAFAEPSYKPNNASAFWFRTTSHDDPLWTFVWRSRWEGEEDALEEAVEAAVEWKAIEVTTQKELEALTAEAATELKEQDPTFDPEDEDDQNRAFDRATSELTYTESGYITSDEYGFSSWDPELTKKVTLAAYYASRMLHPTDEDTEMSEPTDDMSPL